jgi:peptidyl-prolyl cis-trans isomerase B (cyclophilin B)
MFANAFRRLGRCGGTAGLLAGLTLAGCGKSQPQQPVVETPTKPGPDTGKGATDPGTNPGPVAIDPKLNQSFEAATIESAEAGVQLPKARTVAGKSIGSVAAKVEALWPTIAFVNEKTGKPIRYTAVVATDQGTIEIALRPDVAPNHCRNFIALARAGYYDGLFFERVVQQEAADDTKARLTLIEGGCPDGTGETGYGHIGYLLKPELSESAKHEEGTVGFCTEGASEVAGVRFYLCLTPAPALDGQFTVFGKITRGIEAARTIAGRTVPPAGTDPAAFHPAAIRAVTITTDE